LKIVDCAAAGPAITALRATPMASLDIHRIPFRRFVTHTS
jgi:hypothetical protein